MVFKIIRVWEEDYDNIIRKYPYLEELGVYRIDNEMYIELNTLDDLIKFQKTINKELIIDDKTIEIYDSWRE